MLMKYVRGFEKNAHSSLCIKCHYGPNMQPSDVLSKFGFLLLLYLWYRPNILVKFEICCPFLHFKPRRRITPSCSRIIMEGVTS